MDSSVDHSHDPAIKKPRFDNAEISLLIDHTVHANDLINLIFVNQRQNTSSNSRKYEYHYSKPTYTHQLFNEEKIDFLTEKTQKAFHELYRSTATENAESDIAPALLIYINCADLTHYSTTRLVDVLIDRETLLAKIEPAIPVSSLSISFAESILDSSRECASLNQIAAMTPPGKLLPASHSSAVAIESALLPSTPSRSSFEMYLASAADHGASELLSRAEKVAMWYIETADSVDFSDERWEVLNLYCTRSESIDGKEMPAIHLFAGYMTLFTFCNPFLGSKIRVCQALVLPHMQGKGLGRKMLLAVYELAKSRSCITEVTVEDPAPAFERLRDAVDCEWVMLNLYEQLRQKKLVLEGSSEPTIIEIGLKRIDVMSLQAKISESFLTGSADVKERSKQLKLTPAQTSFAYEALQYSVLIIPLIDTENSSARELASSAPALVPASILLADSSGVARGSEISKAVLAALSLTPEYKTFRLAVKRRLLSSNKYLKEQSSSVMQLELEKLFKEQVIRYSHCLPSIRRISLPQAPA